MNTSMKRNLTAFKDSALNLFCMSVLTGLFAGVVITFYNVLMNIGENTSEELYTLLLENPAFIPLLFVGLAAGAVVIGTLVRFVPMIRGSGIPQIEGAARGEVRFKWYVTMCSMFAASLACVFMGYPAGAEGPSLEMGGCCGAASATILRRHMMVKRLQIASGASAGLAVAFNAPITGVVFAMEEAFRSFSPQVFICATVSVLTALVTRNAIRPAIGYGVSFAFTEFVFHDFDALSYVYLAVGALVTSLVGVGFYYLVFAMKKVFKKITFFKGAGKYMIPFVLAGAFGLITLYSLGGGHAFIDALATEGGKTSINISVFGLGLIASLVIIVIIRLITAVMSMSCGVPCGVFIPMLAIGAGCGAVTSVLFQQAGMPAELSDYFIIICMSAFFTCVVKAPVTGIVMVFELTGSFVNFLPALLGVAIGYAVGFLFKTDAIYEKNLQGFIADERIREKFEKVRVTLEIRGNARIDGKAIRQVIWPVNGLVVSRIGTDGVQSVPDGETVLSAGESIVFECETDDEKELMQYLEFLAGKQDEKVCESVKNDLSE
ncbi:MAG: chloride channel protein [Clostridia bacterium]|nr:chloride channel protein [Clostridia bacterium]